MRSVSSSVETIFSRFLEIARRLGLWLSMVPTCLYTPLQLVGIPKTRQKNNNIAFVARNDSESLNQRDEGVEAARKLGLEILAEKDTYEPGTTDFFPVMSSVVGKKPDLLVLSGAAPADTPLLIKTAW